MNNKYLLVRLSSMGDLIHTLPAITDLSRHRPEVDLHWLCEAAFADIARLHPFVKQVHMMRWRSWRKKLFQAATWREINQLKNNLQSNYFNQVIDSQGLIKSAVFAKMVGSPILGLDKHSAREPFAAHFYQQGFAVQKGKDAVWRNRQLFAQIFDYQIEGAPDFGVRIPPEVSDSLKLPASYYVALHATSRDSKLWLMDNWLNLFKQIQKQDPIPILLTWGNETERQRAEKMAGALPFVQVCSKFNLLQATFLLQNAKAVVGVDTGLLHLANAVNVPLVGIYTDSDPVKTGVQPSDWARHIGGVGQMPNVAEVFDLLEQCLKNKIQAA